MAYNAEHRQLAKRWRQAHFLAALLGNNGIKRQAAREAGIPLSTVHHWYAHDPDFYEHSRGLFAVAHQAALEDKILARLARLKWIAELSR